jgi:hypothetical protein
MDGENGSRFAMGELAILSKVESLENRLQYMDHLLTKWKYESDAVVFDREDWMSTDDNMPEEMKN